MTEPKFTTRQKQVADFLLEGKSNKQIAHALAITERTVEDHIKKIFFILEVHSRAEAMSYLWKTTELYKKRISGESTVAETGERGYGGKASNWTLEKEAAFPDEHTVGQTIPRSNASRLEVHGLFGASQAWPAQPGYARYNDIRIPDAVQLHLKLRYSKHSPSLVPILIFIDNEPTPRARIILEDQGNWNRFVWTELISLGEVKAGVHSFTFYTEGQEYGVADLDRFTLTTEPPP